jgi:hypothetical protein
MTVRDRFDFHLDKGSLFDLEKRMLGSMGQNAADQLGNVIAGGLLLALVMAIY